MVSIVIVGTGNLARQWVDSIEGIEGYNLIGIIGRTDEALKHFEGKTALIKLDEEIPQADLCLLAVSDDAIHQVSLGLSGFRGIIAHCSGSVHIEEIARQGRRAVFYPLQSFTSGMSMRLSEVPICIEVENNADLEVLKQFAGKLSTRVEEINSEDRKYLHLAAVYANNFTNHLYSIAQEILKKKNLDPTLLEALIQHTAVKIKTMSAREAQTGPARRGDSKTMKTHMAMIDNEVYSEIYRLLSQSIQTVYHEEL